MAHASEEEKTQQALEDEIVQVALVMGTFSVRDVAATGKPEDVLRAATVLERLRKNGDLTSCIVLRRGHSTLMYQWVNT